GDAGDFRIADDAQVLLLESLAVVLVHQLLGGVLLESLAATVEALHHVARRLALAEARDLDVLRLAGDGLVDGRLEFLLVGGDVELDQASRLAFGSEFHAFRVPSLIWLIRT